MCRTEQQSRVSQGGSSLFGGAIPPGPVPGSPAVPGSPGPVGKLICGPLDSVALVCARLRGLSLGPQNLGPTEYFPRAHTQSCSAAFGDECQEFVYNGLPHHGTKASPDLCLLGSTVESTIVADSVRRSGLDGVFSWPSWFGYRVRPANLVEGGGSRERGGR